MSKPRKPRKRKYRRTDYRIFFERIALGTLRVNIETAVVETFCIRCKAWRPLLVTGDDKFEDKSYEFIRVYHRGSCRKIAVHRLIWMVANGKTDIPPGFDIDHIDVNQKNNHHSNLRLRESRENQSKSEEYTQPDDF